MPSRIVIVNADVFANTLTPSLPGQWWRTDYGLPKDAKLIGKLYHTGTDTFRFCFEHPSFAEVPDGDPIPEFRGVEMHGFAFESPASESTIASLNLCTESQIERHTRWDAGAMPTPYDESDLQRRPQITQSPEQKQRDDQMIAELVMEG